jgi:hypothetical protein
MRGAPEKGAPMSNVSKVTVDCSRRLLTLGSIAKALDCSKASVRRRSKTDPNFPKLRVINNLLYGFEDEILEYMETRPVETETPPVFQSKIIEADEAAA